MATNPSDISYPLYAPITVFCGADPWFETTLSDFIAERELDLCEADLIRASLSSEGVYRSDPGPKPEYVIVGVEAGR